MKICTRCCSRSVSSEFNCFAFSFLSSSSSSSSSSSFLRHISSKSSFSSSVCLSSLQNKNYSSSRCISYSSSFLLSPPASATVVVCPFAKEWDNLNSTAKALLKDCRPIFSIVGEQTDNVKKQQQQKQQPLLAQELEQNRLTVSHSLRRFVIAANLLHKALLSMHGISSSDPLPELVKRKILPSAAMVYAERFRHFERCDPSGDEDIHLLEAAASSAINYFSRLKLSLRQYFKDSHVAKSKEHDENDDENDDFQQNELDEVFSFMESVITDLVEVFGQFCEGDSSVHPHAMQLLTSYVLAVEESFLLIRWEHPSKDLPPAMRECFDSFQKNVLAFLSGMARFPLERSLGHLPPLSPHTLKAQLDNLLNFHNTWAQFVDDLDS